MHGGDASDDQVARNGAGIVDAHVHPGPDAGADDHAVEPGQLTHGAADRLRHGWDHGGEDRAVDSLDIHAVGIDDLLELNRVFRLGLPCVRMDPDDVEDLSPVDAAEDNVGVAHVDGKDHFSFSFFCKGCRFFE